MKRPLQKFVTQEDDYFTTILWMLRRMYAGVPYVLNQQFITV
jgi:hypothetical protein